MDDDFFCPRAPSKHEQRLAVLRNLCERRGIISTQDCERAGIDRRVLLRAVKDQLFERVGRGWYRSRHIDPADHYSDSLLRAAYSVKEPVLCGPSAARYWNLLVDLQPEKLWIAAPRGQWQPKIPHVRWVSWAEWRYAENLAPFPGLPLQISSPERSIVELVAYRDELGIEFAREAMLTFVQDPRQAFGTMLCIAEQLGCRDLVSEMYGQAWERIDELEMRHVWHF